MNLPAKYLNKIRDAEIIFLFLDYDGTLADFAPTPDDVLPDPQLIALLEDLTHHPKINPTIISGRRLAHIEKLVPISGIWLAGSYGLEMRTPKGEYLHRADYTHIRPTLEELKPEWTHLIEDQQGFFLEDKGWSLALHARFADDVSAIKILAQARSLVKKSNASEIFQILGGHKFLEIAPKEADKGNTVLYLLQHATQSHFFSIYIGDDDKDERAFPIIQEYGGLSGRVCNSTEVTKADFLISSPQDTRTWLANLLDFFD